MAAMATALTEFSDNGDSRTYALVSHTALKPQLLIQKRKVPSGKQVMIEDTVTVLLATEDVDGAVMPQRVSVAVSVRRPLGHDSADMTSVLSIIRDVIAGDEFGTLTTTQKFLV